ncbi:MAG: DUF2807 domain-containing protein [Myxococcaceae bacterium]|nr:DUF2807 domain-containing protein [Myxococcaceae bacterium]
MLISISTAVVLAGLVTQDRPVEKFTQLRMEGGIVATVHRGAQPALTLTGEEKTLQRLESVVEKGVLVLRYKEKSWFKNDGTVQADITVTELGHLEASGGCIIKGDGLGGPACGIAISGGVEVDLKGAVCEALTVTASGGTKVKLKGTAQRLAVDASGGSALDTRGLLAQAAKIEGAGGFVGKVSVVESVEGDLSGGASLQVKGHPKTRKVKTSGAASVSYAQ